MLLWFSRGNPIFASRLVTSVLSSAARRFLGRHWWDEKGYTAASMGPDGQASPILVREYCLALRRYALME